ncbi:MULTISPECIES: ribosomal protein S18-alanine N-acetyltransferase [Protofrankia]|uniref:Ribosomal-protein-alanine acetyltransferase n=1 Tax=Candidatus Protofrankia datiscae TaxID=2716812 RepID=F8AUZ0_9ACTN|nr:ribosomal-protein-alanine acetyltransferase [Candidatus Protofrankia datiscae]
MNSPIPPDDTDNLQQTGNNVPITDDVRLDARSPRDVAAPRDADGVPGDVSVPGNGAAPAADAVRRGQVGQVVFEPLRWWHLGDIVVLERKIFAEDAWTPELFWSELAQGAARHYLTAVRDDQIIGYGGLAVHDDESYIQTLGVAADARGRGVATRLLVALLRHARTRDARRCELEVRTDNAVAQSLYRRLGFVELGVRRGYYQPSGADAYVMSADRIHTGDYGRMLDAAEQAVSR